MLLGIYARSLGRAGQCTAQLDTAESDTGLRYPSVNSCDSGKHPVLAGITAILHNHRQTSSGAPFLAYIYNAEFAFNDLTNSRARVGLLYERISRLLCLSLVLIGVDDYVPIARRDRELFLNKFPALCKYEVCTLCLTCLRILRTERGDEDTIGIRQEWIREFLLCVTG